MNRKNQERSGSEGRMPAMAPLANPYVPFQPEDPPQYDSRFGLVRGTLFPGLDLPFMGLVNKNELPVNPKTELQVMAFAINELALYLDTHRDDQEALALYQTYQKMYHDGAKEYSQMCQPLTHQEPTTGPYRWLDDPWPWEYCANKEA